MSNQANCAEELDKVRDIEGFPLGEDKDICALSDPPYYTAYPNPHIADFIAEHGTPYDEETDDYHREPFVSDVSEGKGGTIYNAHTYHTKVPYKAIMPFIEHYTKSGDIVFDGFCGTGMTGIAAQQLGRKAILADLSPAATFIASNYNTPTSPELFRQTVNQILKDLKREYGWMYETWHPHSHHPERVKARINYTVWSDVFICPYCGSDVVFWNAAVEKKTKKVNSRFNCPECSASLSKRSMDKVTRKVFDPALGRSVLQAKLQPVLVNYILDKQYFEKEPDEYDLEIIERVEELNIPYWYPTQMMMFREKEWGDQWREGAHSDITHVHHFYLKRSLWCQSAYANAVKHDERYLILLTAISAGLASKLTRYNMGKRGNGARSGTLYVPSLIAEPNVFKVLDSKLKNVSKMSSEAQPGSAAVTTQSGSDLKNIPRDTVDYIFTDPPFGDNLVYAELNFLSESWLKVFTNEGREAIISEAQDKDLRSYHQLMANCFAEFYRVLKPGRWITVEFHNSKASVWNAIQDALSRAGFIVAQVAVLDKKQGSYNQVVAAGAVKNDLVINAYKPQRHFEEKFLGASGEDQERLFIEQLLEMLPSSATIERTREMLYSKMLAYYIQRGYEINMNSAQFYRMLGEEFVERDGYWFRDEVQAQEYEQRKLDPARKREGLQGQGVLFVSDERSAIAWLHQFLGQGPRSYSDIYTAYAKALQTSEDQIPELKQLLEETCVQVNGDWKRPDALTAEELEERRRQRLLRQFDEYLRQARTGQSLSDVRKEAILTGFEEAYRDKRFDDIVKVGEKLDQRVIDSSTEIFDFIDIAETKMT